MKKLFLHSLRKWFSQCLLDNLRFIFYFKGDRFLWCPMFDIHWVTMLLLPVWSTVIIWRTQPPLPTCHNKGSEDIWMVPCHVDTKWSNYPFPPSIYTRWQVYIAASDLLIITNYYQSSIKEFLTRNSEEARGGQQGGHPSPGRPPGEDNTNSSPYKI